MSININMSLHKRHWLGEHIEAGSYEVHIENLMVSYNAEHSLVVVGGGLRIELNDDPCLGMGLDCSFSSGEGENVRFICEELEGCWLIALIHDVQQSVSH